MVTDRGGDTRELAYYPLRQLFSFFFEARSFRRIRSPLLSLSSLISFLPHGHQSASYVDQPRFATCSSKSCQPNPACTHARKPMIARAVVHATWCDPRRPVRQTKGNPGRSSSTCRRLKSDRIGQRVDGDPRCSSFGNTFLHVTVEGVVGNSIPPWTTLAPDVDAMHSVLEETNGDFRLSSSRGSRYTQNDKSTCASTWCKLPPKSKF